MSTKVPRNAALRVVPQPARSSMFTGSLNTRFRRKSSIGMRCKAPYIGSIHRNTWKNRSRFVNVCESLQGWSAEQGTKRGPKDCSGGGFMA